MAQQFNTIEVVVKVSERCNIACDYCYMFYKGNDDYTRHPTYIPEESVEALAKFLVDSVKVHGSKHVFVHLHGGEPLMVGKRRFNELCKQLRDAIKPVAELTF